MKKLRLSFIIISLFFLTNCAPNTTIYYPGYANDYVYSIGYYGYRPYWGGRYSTNSGWITTGWSGSTSHYSRSWYGYVSRW